MRPPPPHDRLAVSLVGHAQESVPAPQRSRPPLSPEERREYRDRAGRAIEEGMRRLGTEDPSGLLDENGFTHLTVGSIRCTLGLIEVDERDLLLVYAPIMDLPSDRELILPLYRLLLELNNRFELAVAKFGLHGDTVFLSAMRPVEGLDAVEVEDMVRWVACFADDIDDRLLAEFGGTSRVRG